MKQDRTAPRVQGFESRSGRNRAERRLGSKASNPPGAKRDGTAPQDKGSNPAWGETEQKRNPTAPRAKGSNPPWGETGWNGASGPRVRIPLREKRDPTAPQGRGFESRSGRNRAETEPNGASGQGFESPPRGETGPNGASGPRVRIPLWGNQDGTAPRVQGFESRSRPVP